MKKSFQEQFVFESSLNEEEKNAKKIHESELEGENLLCEDIQNAYKDLKNNPDIKLDLLKS